MTMTRYRTTILLCHYGEYKLWCTVWANNLIATYSEHNLDIIIQLMTPLLRRGQTAIILVLPSRVSMGID